jgi:hypothetical protein
MIKLYIKEIEVTERRDLYPEIIYKVLSEEDYKKEKNKKNYTEIFTELSFEQACAYPDYWEITDNILNFKNAVEVKNYTYRLILLDDKSGVATNFLTEGFYPIKDYREWIIMQCEKELNQYEIMDLQNYFIYIEGDEIKLKEGTSGLYKIDFRQNLWEEKEHERLTNRKLY